MKREELYQKVRDNIRAIYVFSCMVLVLVLTFITFWMLEDARTGYLQNLLNDEAVDLLLDLKSNSVQENEPLFTLKTIHIWTIRPYTELGSYGTCSALEPKVVQATGQIHHPIPQPVTP